MKAAAPNPQRVALRVTEEQDVISIHVANLPLADAQFLGNVVALFCDPQSEPIADSVRAGRLALAVGRNSTIDLIPYNPTQN